MTVDGVALDSTIFEPIKVSEDRLEGLLRSAAPAIFPGYDYFDFRPAIRCAEGTRHPDGVLLAPGHHRWWVVEVETHLHSVSDHIEPQLRDLAQGFYGPDAFAYLTRHSSFDGPRYPVDTFEPQFLLVIDSLTPEIRDAATRTNFLAIECGVFRSEQNRYALTVVGPRPRRDTLVAGPGLDLRLEDRAGVSILIPADGKPLPMLKTDDVIIAGAVLTTYPLAKREGMVIALSPAELRASLGETDHFRLSANGRMVAVQAASTTVVVKE